MTLKEDLLEAADGLARRCDCGGGANGFKHGPDCVSEYAPIVRSHATAVAAQEAELADLRERLAFSRAGNATLTECGVGMAAELASLRVRLGEAERERDLFKSDAAIWQERAKAEASRGDLTAEKPTR